MLEIKAKVKCESVLLTPHAEQVHFRAVYSNDKDSENYSYSQATPLMEVSMTITNPDARGCFVPGDEYVLTFSPSIPIIS